MLTKQQLIGTWESNDNPTLGSTSVDFKENDTLTYTIHLEKKDQIINLVYWIKDDYLFTDQPSSPNIEKSKAYIKNDKLYISYGTFEVVYTKNMI